MRDERLCALGHPLPDDRHRVFMTVEERVVATVVEEPEGRELGSYALGDLTAEFGRDDRVVVATQGSGTLPVRDLGAGRAYGPRERR